MLEPLLKRTSTYPASTSTELSREPAMRKGLRYKTRSFRAGMNTDRIRIVSILYIFWIMSLCESHISRVLFNNWLN